MLRLYAVCDGRTYPTEQYLYYSRREAMARYREKYGLKGRHGVVFHTPLTL